MEFKIKQPVLKAALAAVQGALEKKTTIPVLANILIESVGDSAIQITATDTEITIRKRAEAEILQAGAMCVLARKVIDLTRTLENSELSFKREANAWVTMRSGKSVFKIAGVGRDSFPDAPLNKSVPVKMPIAAFRSLVERTVFAASKDPSKFAFQPVKFDVADGFAVAVASDGYRLAEMTVPAEGEIACLMPANAVRIAAGLSGDSLSIGTDHNFVFFEADDCLIAARKVSAAFPNYKILMPKDGRPSCTFSLEQFRAIVRRASLMCVDRNRSFRLNLTPNEIKITTKSPEEGEMAEYVETEYDGPECVFGIQWPYLLDYLVGLGDQKDLTMLFDPEHNRLPVEFRAGEGYRYIVVPLNLEVGVGSAAGAAG